MDFGVEFRVVAKDVEGISPPNTVLPRLMEVRDRHRIGGRYDTLTHKFIGDCHRWPVWLIGEKQFDIVFRLRVGTRFCSRQRARERRLSWR